MKCQINKELESKFDKDDYFLTSDLFTPGESWWQPVLIKIENVTFDINVSDRNCDTEVNYIVSTYYYTNYNKRESFDWRTEKLSETELQRKIKNGEYFPYKGNVMNSIYRIAGLCK